MLKLVRFLKPYALMIIIALVLILVQANADLALPAYLADIVNIGIQQGGVHNVTPDAVRKTEMDKYLLFIPSADHEQVLAAYDLVDQSSPDYEKYVELYPAVENEPVYVLQKVSEDELAWLDQTLAPAMLMVSGIEKAVADPAAAAQMGAQFGFDLSKIPPGTDVFTLLAQVPEQQRMAMLDGVKQQFAGMPPAALEQAAKMVTYAEYEAIGMDLNRLQTTYILEVGALMLVVTLISAAATIGLGYFASKSAAGVARDLRKAVFGKVESFSNTEFDRFSTASLITRNTNDVTQIQMFLLMMLRMVLYAPIVAIGGIYHAIGLAPSMSWIIALGVGILIVMVSVMLYLAVPKFTIIQKLTDRLNLVTRENLSGMMVIRAFNTQPFEENRFDRANLDLTSNNLFVNRLMAFLFPAMMFLMNGISILIIWVGAKQVAAASIQVGDMLAFMQYAMQIVFSFLMMTFMFILVPRAMVSGRRISEVLDTETVIVDQPQVKSFPEPFRGEVEFRNVSFRYPDAEEDVLCSVSFKALPGQTTAIIGSTGSGKSTVVNLIPRFYDVSGGNILIDGLDIREVSQQDLREHIGYIPQKANLFSGTIGSNLRFADENAPEERVEEAMHVSQAAEFIKSDPDGLDAEVSQGGMNLSGGQKQRMSIARALVKRAPIYIFDDSFSALDFRTDAALRRALKENTADSCLLIVTQRVSTIKNAEKIVVLDDGQVAGIGTHTELMNSCETYREIALSQLSVEELA
jgi:ATP-binding cassette, subfamily B, multidrug efflux pump